MIEDGVEGFHGVAGKADGANFALLFGFLEGGPGFFPNLWEGNELDIVHEEDVEVIGAESVEGGVE